MKRSNDSVQQLQVLEQSRQAVVAQKQKVQADVFEVENALKELESVDSAYKIVGGIMVRSDSKKLVEELSSKKEALELRSKTLDAQEIKIKDKVKRLQEEVLKE